MMTMIKILKEHGSSIKDRFGYNMDTQKADVAKMLMGKIKGQIEIIIAGDDLKISIYTNELGKFVYTYKNAKHNDYEKISESVIRTYAKWVKRYFFKEN